LTVDTMEIEKKIHDLQFKVVVISAVMGCFIIGIGFAIWGKFYWGWLLGLAMGVFSFHILVATVARLQGSSKWAMGLGFAASSLKIAAMLIFLGILYRFGVELIHVLGGLLFSQFAIVGAAMTALKKQLPNSSGASNARS